MSKMCWSKTKELIAAVFLTRVLARVKIYMLKLSEGDGRAIVVQFRRLVNNMNGIWDSEIRGTGRVNGGAGRYIYKMFA